MKRGIASFFVVTGLCLSGALNGRGGVSTTNFFNFETAPVHPVALSPDATRLALCNLPKGHLEIFDVTSGAVVIEATKGAFRFVTGSQDKRVYQIKTPFGTLGIRG